VRLFSYLIGIPQSRSRSSLGTTSLQKSPICLCRVVLGNQPEVFPRGPCCGRSDPSFGTIHLRTLPPPPLKGVLPVPPSPFFCPASTFVLLLAYFLPRTRYGCVQVLLVFCVFDQNFLGFGLPLLSGSPCKLLPNWRQVCISAKLTPYTFPRLRFPSASP